MEHQTHELVMMINKTGLLTIIPWEGLLIYYTWMQISTWNAQEALQIKKKKSGILSVFRN